eukprot:scaffold36104_cov72-Isochrysis_galbana.AAC.3
MFRQEPGERHGGRELGQVEELQIELAHPEEGNVRAGRRGVAVCRGQVRGGRGQGLHKKLRTL